MLADSIVFDDDTAYQVVHYHYGTNTPPTVDGLKAALKDHTYRFADEAKEFDIQIDGQLASSQCFN